MRTGTVAIIAALVIATALASGPIAFAGDPEPLIAPVCPADLNGDSIVDSADLNRLLRFYGACVNCKEDLNGDKFVDDVDVAIMTRQWGPCPPEGDVFGGDRSNGDTASLADVAVSLTDPKNDPTPTTLDRARSPYLQIWPTSRPKPSASPRPPTAACGSRFARWLRNDSTSGRRTWGRSCCA